MRLTALALLSAIACAFALLNAPIAGAKVVLFLTPESGPPGSIVRVEGIGGFQTGYEARIILLPAEDFAPTPGALTQYSNESDLPGGILLATVLPDQNYSFDVKVTIPSSTTLSDAFGDDQTDLKVVAIGRNDQLGGFFALNGAYTLTSVTAPSAGTGDGHGPRLPGWPLWASLGVASATGCLAAGCIAVRWRFRISRREVRYADNASGGPEGP